MTDEVTFPNWQSRLLLSRAARAQPIGPAKLPWLAKAMVRLYEQAVLRVDVRGIEVDRPIYLIGMPRSGTSMIQDLLCAHSGVAYLNNTMNRYPTEFCALDDLRRRLKLDFRNERYIGDSVDVSASSPSDSVNFWAHWFKLDAYALDYQPFKASDFSPAEVQAMYDMIRRVIWCFGKPWRRFFSKLLVPMPHLDVVRDLFPDACYVHIVRDGRMTANSMLKHCQREREQQDRFPEDRPQQLGPNGEMLYFTPYPRFPKLAEYARQFGVQDIRTTAHLWDDAMTYVDSIKHTFKHYYEVRFEDIVADPHAQIGRILEFCELEPVPQDNAQFWGKIGGVGKVRHKNKYEGFEVIEEICRDNLLKHGYLQGDPTQGATS